jgi:hypothetical protein
MLTPNQVCTIPSIFLFGGDLAKNADVTHALKEWVELQLKVIPSKHNPL